MKKGFTLAEIIVALGVIAVLAAITQPMLGKIIPDKNKMQVLKVHKIVSEVNEILLNDSALYFSEHFPGEVQPCSGLSCTGRPLSPDFNNNIFEGDTKYLALLTEHLQIKDPNNLNINNNATVDFETIDGISWSFYDYNQSRTDATEYFFLVDVDANGDDCTYGDNNCNSPDIFEFRINNAGQVLPNDPLARAYLDNPHVLNDKRRDLERARDFVNAQ